MAVSKQQVEALKTRDARDPFDHGWNAALDRVLELIEADEQAQLDAVRQNAQRG